MTTWREVASRFVNLKPTFPDTHERIDTFPLRRCRMPMEYFESLIREFDKSVLRVGHDRSFINVAAVHEYTSPVPSSSHRCFC
jgi:hypothetical protein